MNSHRAARALIAALACTAGVAQAGIFDKIAAARQEAGPFDLGADLAAQAKVYVAADDLDELKGIRRVAIPSFLVEYAIENSATATASTNLGGSWTKSSAALVGVDRALFERLTDAFYDKLVADLTALGYEVVPYATVQANANYQAMKPKFKPSPEQVGTKDGTALYYSAHGMPVYFRTDDPRLSALGGLKNAFSITHPGAYEPRIAKDLDAAVLRVRMVVDIAKQSTSGGMMSSSSSVSTQAELSLMAKFTEFMFVTPGNDVATLQLAKHVNVAGPVLTLAKEGDANYVTPDLTSMGGSSGRSVKYAIVTTPEAYGNAVTAHFNAVEQMFLLTLAAQLGLELPPAAPSAPAAPAPEAPTEPPASPPPAAPAGGESANGG